MGLETSRDIGSIRDQPPPATIRGAQVWNHAAYADSLEALTSAYADGKCSVAVITVKYVPRVPDMEL